MTPQELIDYLKKYQDKKGNLIVYPKSWYSEYQSLAQSPLIFEARKNKRYDSAPSRTLPIKKLRPTQPSILVSNLLNILQGQPAKGTEHEVPAVAKRGGNYYILNGHHRLWIEQKLGNSQITIPCFDLDAEAAQETPQTVLPKGKVSSETLLSFLNYCLSAGKYTLPVGNYYVGDQFWSRQVKNSPLVSAYLKGQSIGQPQSINTRNIRSVNKQELNVQYLKNLLLGQSAVNEPVVTFKINNIYYAPQGFEKLWLANKLGTSSINGNVIDLDVTTRKNI